MGDVRRTGEAIGMEQLRVIGTEDDRLVVATEAGDRFALALDDVLRAELRRVRRESDAPEKRASPREIQSHIRAGLSTKEAADLLGLRVEDVQRFGCSPSASTSSDRLWPSPS
jgi:hypothetical protein